MRKIVIATRGSALALWQANHIKSLLEQKYTDIYVELLVLKTKGDIILDVPLAKVGGKGLFVKEIEDALLNGTADLAVHSMKDVPMILPEGLTLGAIPPRGVPTDLFLSEKYESLNTLPQGASLGTSSLRRQAQVLNLRPDLNITFLRGNVETRLRKMQEGQYDAIILASAGMKRMGLSAKYEQELAPPIFIPAVGQGALGLQIREDDEYMTRRIFFLNHEPTRICVEAERAFLRALDGGCQVPIAGFATLNGESVSLSVLVAEPDGSIILHDEGTSVYTERENLGKKLAKNLLDKGAKEILDRLYLAQ